MLYLLLKSLHLVAMVAWFAGLFYLVRLFVYHVEAFQKPALEQQTLVKQYSIMEDRLYRIICRPAMLLTWVFGVSMIIHNGWDWLSENYWLHFKLLLVFLLSGYTEYNGKIVSRLAKGEAVMSSDKFRLFNEVPTIFLLTIILLAVFKNMLDFGYTFIGVVVFVIVLMLMSKLYKKLRVK